MAWFKKNVNCAYESSNGDCSLIQKLKELQAQKKEVDKQIKNYAESHCASVDNFVALLVKMEEAKCFLYCNHGIFLDHESGVRKHFEYSGTSHLEYALGFFSENSVRLMCNELKDLSNKVNVIAEKKELANKLTAEIKKIKDTLGIE